MKNVFFKMGQSQKKKKFKSLCPRETPANDSPDTHPKNPLEVTSVIAENTAQCRSPPPGEWVG